MQRHIVESGEAIAYESNRKMGTRPETRHHRQEGQYLFAIVHTNNICGDGMVYVGGVYA